jgi:hypothetical protein
MQTESILESTLSTFALILEVFPFSINPTKDLSPATTYYVLVDDGAILDGCNKNFGISSNTTVRFSTTAT